MTPRRFTAYSTLVLTALMLAASPTTALPQGMCRAPQNSGSPCLDGTGLSLAATPDAQLNLGVGNPVNIATGHKYQREIDLPGQTDAPLHGLIRHYRSGWRKSGVLGPGWTLDFDFQLIRSATGYLVQQPDGSVLELGPDKRSGTVIPGTHPVWVRGPSNRLTFDTQGQLLRIEQPDGIMTLLRSAGGHPSNRAISRIESARDVLVFSYRQHGTQRYLTQVAGRRGRVHYDYESVAGSTQLRLKQVRAHDGSVRRYLYSPTPPAPDAFFLSGIDVAASISAPFQPLRRWQIDRRGRVVAMTLFQDTQLDRRIATGAGRTISKSGIEGAVSGQTWTLDYPQSAGPQQAGLTTVTGPDGQRTQFHLAWQGGRNVLAAVSGAACPACTAPGTRARYDSNGKLIDLNQWSIQRDAGGRVRRLSAHRSGWAKLKLTFDEFGRNTGWSSSLTGPVSFTQWPSGGASRTTRQQFGPTAWHDLVVDASGHLVKRIEHADAQTTTTLLNWQHNRLVSINHPNETETRRYDATGHWMQRTLSRPAQGGNPAFSQTDAFTYDAQGRLSKHGLPEGGSLNYRWSTRGQLDQLIWTDRRGQTHIVVSTETHRGRTRPGYRYGNGLVMRVTVASRHTQLTLGAQGRTVWAHQLQTSRRGLVTGEQLTGRTQERWKYGHDRQWRLAQAQGSGQQYRFAWDRNGALAAVAFNQMTAIPGTTRSATGLPTTLYGFRLEYGPNRRLTRVQRDADTATVYTHNAYGYRISAQHGKRMTQYSYLGRRLVTEQTFRSGQPTHLNRYVYAANVPVAFIQYSANQPDGILYFVHADLLGAPRLITDAHQRVRWQASYTPTGQAHIEGDLVFNLRWPGQVADADSPFYDNLLRTFDPRSGSYLEPDPLGPMPGHDALGYAAQQPRRYIDPMGLMLFAFDGTRNDASTQSNVWKLSQRYEDGAVYYQPGPGNSTSTDWDAVTAYSANDIIERQWQFLLDALAAQPTSANNLIPVDIVGYSRGAAMARDFGNKVADHTRNQLFSFNDPVRGLVSACLDTRFMGLFDTVAQFGVGGSRNGDFDMTISPAWAWVAHAVALNERRWLFPLMVVNRNGALNTIEAPFIGAHADVGGGIVLDEDGGGASRGDLSDVSLNWMMWQARAANLSSSTQTEDQIIGMPLLHDARSPLMRTVQNGDRKIQRADGTALYNYQDEDPRLGRATRDAVEAFIQRKAQWQSQEGSEVGTVDLKAYADWLYTVQGWRPDGSPPVKP